MSNPESEYSKAVRIGKEHRDPDVAFMVQQANTALLKHNVESHEMWKRDIIRHVKTDYPDEFNADTK